MSNVIGHYDWWLLSFAAALAVIASLNAVRLFNFAQQRQGRAEAEHRGDGGLVERRDCALRSCRKL